jgi:CRP-like cAMP-binding protein
VIATSPSGPLGRLSAFDKGETIFREGDAPGSLAKIASGREKVVKMLPSGKEIILEIFAASSSR